MIKRTELKELELLKTNFKQTLIGPEDDYYKYALVGGAQHYGIYDPDLIGYMAIKDGIMYEFHCLADPDTYFNDCIAKYHLKGLRVATYAPLYHRLCKTYGHEERLEGYFFEEDKNTHYACPIDDVAEVRAEMSHHKLAMAYTEREMLEDLDFVDGYYGDLIQIKGLYLYILNETVVATGEVRIRPDIPGYANIGMTVAQDYRRKGMGTYILQRMKLIAHQNGLRAICGTDVENIGSKSAIENAGFKLTHELLAYKIEA